MSRTRRNDVPNARRKPRVVRDGKISGCPGCRPGGSCDWCCDNRLHRHVRAALPQENR